MKIGGRYIPPGAILMAVVCLIVVLWMLLLSGCAAWGRLPTIKTKGATVSAPRDAGKPANLSTSQAGESLELPKGSRIWLRQKDAVPATEDAPFSPATSETEVSLAESSTWNRTAETVSADTGTVDVSLAKHRIDSAAAQPLLWAAIGAAVAAVAFLYIKYPTPALICGGASVVFFIAWKVAGIPTYFWCIGACALVAAFFLWRGHLRGLVDADGDGIADILQRPRSNSNVPPSTQTKI